MPGRNSAQRRQLLAGGAAATRDPRFGSGFVGLGRRLGQARKEEVKIGFIPLTDCASVVMAAELGFDKKYGIKIIPSKEASWAGVRIKLGQWRAGRMPTCCTA